MSTELNLSKASEYIGMGINMAYIRAARLGHHIVERNFEPGFYFISQSDRDRNGIVPPPELADNLVLRVVNGKVVEANFGLYRLSDYPLAHPDWATSPINLNNR